MLQKMLQNVSSGSDIKIISVQDATVESAGTYQECGFRPTKIYATYANSAAVGYYVYDEETGVNDFHLRGSGTATSPATNYITIDDNGFLLKPYGSGMASSAANKYCYIAVS